MHIYIYIYIYISKSNMHGYQYFRSRKEQEGLGLDEGSSPLHMAAKRGIPEIVKKLIDLGADVNALDVHGNNPLHAAALDVKDTLYNPKYPREGLEKAVDILVTSIVYPSHIKKNPCLSQSASVLSYMTRVRYCVKTRSVS